MNDSPSLPAWASRPPTNQEKWILRVGGAFLFALVMVVGFARFSPLASIIVLCVGAISSGIATLAIPGIFDWIFMVMYYENLRAFQADPKRAARLEKGARFIRIVLPLAMIAVGIVGLMRLAFVAL